VEKWKSSLIDENALDQITQKIVPPELLNNLAVLQLENGNLNDAKTLLSEALLNCETLLSS
jgi:hypothetical protein